jgi:hypothetical protein
LELDVERRRLREVHLDVCLFEPGNAAVGIDRHRVFPGRKIREPITPLAVSDGYLGPNQIRTRHLDGSPRDERVGSNQQFGIRYNAVVLGNRHSTLWKTFSATFKCRRINDLTFALEIASLSIGE